MPSVTSLCFKVVTGTGECTLLLQRTHNSSLEPRVSHGSLERGMGDSICSMVRGLDQRILQRFVK